MNFTLSPEAKIFHFLITVAFSPIEMVRTGCREAILPFLPGEPILPALTVVNAWAAAKRDQVQRVRLGPTLARRLGNIEDCRRSRRKALDLNRGEAIRGIFRPAGRLPVKLLRLTRGPSWSLPTRDQIVDFGALVLGSKDFDINQ